jgi:hypothetical protein
MSSMDGIDVIRCFDCGIDTVIATLLKTDTDGSDTPGCP